MHTFHQKERYLRENGFILIRSIKHGSVWTDGTTRISVSRSRNHAHEFLKDVKKALEVRASRKSPEEKIMPIKTATAKLGDLPSFKTVLSSTQSENRRVMIVPSTPTPPSIAASKPKKTALRFEPEIKYIIFLRVEELLKQKFSPSQIHLMLVSEGVKMPNGDPITHVYTTYMIGIIRSGKIIVDPTKKKETEVQPNEANNPIIPMTAPKTSLAPRLPESITSILTDPALSDRMKVAMVTAWANET